MPANAHLRRLLCAATLAVAGCSVFLPSERAWGVPYYWDVNGATTGAGSNATGTWDATTANWNLNSTGTGSTTTWSNNNTAYFAAGTDATSPYVVSVIGTHTITGLRVEEGAVTLNGGILNLLNEPTIVVGTGVTATVNSKLTGNQPLIIQKDGTTSLLILGGDNDYTGDTKIVGAGAVRATSATAFSTGLVTIDDATTVEFGDVGNVANNFRFTNVTGVKSLRLVDSSSNANIQGLVEILATSATNFSFNANGGNLTINQVKSTSGAGLRTLGTGTITFAASNVGNLTGAVSLNGGGTVVAAHAGAFASAAVSLSQSNTTLELADGITLPNNISISSSGDQKFLRLRSGATSATFGGIMTIATSDKLVVDAQGGTLTFSNQMSASSTASWSFRQDGNGTVVLAAPNNFGGQILLAGDGAVLRIAHNSALSGSTTRALLMSASNTVVELADGVESMFRPLQVNDQGDIKTLRLQAGATSGIHGGGTTISESTPENFRIDAGGGTLTIRGQLSGLGGAGLRVAGSGVVELSSSSITYSGGTVIDGDNPTLRLINSSKLPSNGVLTIRNGVLQLSGTVDTTVMAPDPPNPAILMGGGPSGSSAKIEMLSTSKLIMWGNFKYSALNNNETAIISGGVFALFNSGFGFDIEDSSAAVDVRIDSQISGNGTMAGFAKTGDGTLKLTTTNVYTGTTIFSGGWIEADAQDRLGNGGTLQFNGGGLRWATGASFDVSQRTTQFAGAAWLDTNGNVVSLASSIGGGQSGRLNKTGAGVLRLNGNSNLSGGMTVHAGVLTVNGTISGGGSVIVGSATTAALNGGGTITGPITLTATGTLSAGTNSAGDDQHGVGHFTAASLDWQSGSRMIFDFGAAQGTAGTDWDRITLTGSGLTLGGANLILELRSWDLTGTVGYGANDQANPANNFDPMLPASWLWIENTGLTDGVISQIVVDAEGGVFLPGSGAPYGQAQGTFWVSSFSNDLYIHYAAVPEPGSLTLSVIAGVGLAARAAARRRRQSTLRNSLR